MKSCLICNERITASARDDNVTSTEIINRFVQQLGVQGQGLEMILCDECYSGVGKATKWREQVGEVERDVRSLQRIILKMMRQLKSLHGSYLEEMRKFEGKIRNTGNGSARKKREKTCITEKADVIRQGILDVVADLSAFKNGLVSPFEGSTTPPEVPKLTAKSKPTSSAQAALPPPIKPQNPLESIIKKEVESSEETASTTGAQAEGSLPHQDPLPTEKDNPIDIEHVVYSENLSKTEPTVDFELPDKPTATTSRRAKSQRKKRSTGQLRYACQICGRKCASPSDLKKHVYTHTGERPHKCHLCPKAFKRNTHLQGHLMSHSGKKPFKCPQCKRGFTRKDHLEEHKRTHTGEKPYKCHLCGRKWSSRKCLKEHLKKEHPNSDQKAN